MATASGGDELCSGCARERAEEGEGVERECEGVQGGGVELREPSRRGGGSQAGRRWPACGHARRARAPAYWREEEGDRGGSGGGLGRLEELGQVG